MTMVEQQCVWISHLFLFPFFGLLFLGSIGLTRGLLKAHRKEQHLFIGGIAPSFQRMDFFFSNWFLFSATPMPDGLGYGLFFRYTQAHFSKLSSVTCLI